MRVRREAGDPFEASYVVITAQVGWHGINVVLSQTPAALAPVQNGFWGEDVVTGVVQLQRGFNVSHGRSHVKPAGSDDLLLTEVKKLDGRHG